jgi:hypothetical protein
VPFFSISHPKEVGTYYLDLVGMQTERIGGRCGSHARFKQVAVRNSEITIGGFPDD